MNVEKHDRRDKFSWGPGDIEIIKAPEKATRKPKTAPAAGEADTAKDDVSPPRQGEPQGGEKQG